MLKNYKKILAGLMVTIIVAPSAFFLRPQKADAFLSCILDAIGLITGIGGIVSSIMSVPTSDKATMMNTGQTAGATQSSNFKECMLDALVSNLVNNMIKNLTASTVQWINSGFEGSPSFITDPEGFFADYGDIVAGQAISELGPVGQILCSPFDLDIRIALAFGFDASGRYYREIGCRLSDVQANIYRAFTGGQWGADGWSSWISISHPRNNAMSAYLRTSDLISRQIVDKTGLKNQEITLGRGFLNFTECVEYENEYEAGGSEPLCVKEVTKTPGAVIEGQLNQTLPAGLRKLEVADEIDEILNALITQATQQIFSSTGLLGGSRPSSRYGGQSYLAQLRNTYSAELESAQAQPPMGVNCDDGPFAIALDTETFAFLVDTDDPNDLRIDKKVIEGRPALPPTGETTRAYAIYDWEPNLDTFIYNASLNKLYSWNHTNRMFSDGTNSYSISELENKIRIGCENTRNYRYGENLANQYLDKNAGGIFGGDGSGGAGTQNPDAGVVRNLAYKANAQADKTHYDEKERISRSPSNAVDGLNDANNYNCYYSGNSGPGARFWIDFNNDQLVQKVKIYLPNGFKPAIDGNPPFDNLDQLLSKQTQVVFYKKTNKGTDVQAQVTLNTDLVTTGILNSYIAPRSVASGINSPTVSYVVPQGRKFGYFEIDFGGNNPENWPDINNLTIKIVEATPGGTYVGLTLGEVEAYGIPKSELSEYAGTTVETRSNSTIGTPNRDGVILYPGNILEYNVAVNSPTKTPDLKITMSVDSIDGSGINNKNLKDMFLVAPYHQNNTSGEIVDFSLYRLGVISENSEDRRLFRPIQNSGGGSNFGEPNIEINSLKVDTLDKIYLRVKAKILDSNTLEANKIDYGNYLLKMKIEENDNGTLKSVGTHVLGFELKEP